MSQESLHCALPFPQEKGHEMLQEAARCNRRSGQRTVRPETRAGAELHADPTSSS